MVVYLQLAWMALLTLAVSVLFYLAEKRTAFGKWNPKARQWIYGVAFGVLSICGTEFAVPFQGVVLNESTAAPLCAGLIFGSPAGVIAGVIGSVERYLASAWGAGYYGRYAGTFSILFAGLAGAGMRRYMFDDKKPAWYYGLASGIIAEVVDMLLLLAVNVDDMRSAFYVVEVAALPLAIMNGVAVMLALLGVSLVAGVRWKSDRSREKLTQTFQKWLLLCVTLAFLATGFFTYWVEDGISDSQNENVLRLNLLDVSQDIQDASDKKLLEITRSVKSLLKDSATDMEKIPLDRLYEIADYYHVAELDLVDEEGIVRATTREGALGYDMASAEQSSRFLVLLKGQKEFVQRYQPTGFDASVSRKYAGAAFDTGGFLQVGYDAEQFQSDLSAQAAAAAFNRHVGESGFIIVCDENWQVVSDPKGHTGQKLETAGGFFLDDDKIAEFALFPANIYEQDCLCMYMKSEGYYIMGVLPKAEATFARDVSLYVSVFMEVLIFTLLFVLIYILTKNLIVDNILRVNDSLARITGGDLEEKVNVRTNQEFATLSDDINTTVTALRHYIDEAAARLDKELLLARAIQRSALPGVFPPYPNRTEFEIWAGMRPAKEVGGDFYDFYLKGEDKLAFVIADVSGKGIPAAMFMMTVKTLLKNLAETGLPVEEVLTEANRQLCEHNQAEMFVTVWMGILDLETGVVSCACAGHNPPLLRSQDGSYSFVKFRPGLVLAGMEGIHYRKNEFTLLPGDTLYLYTDGVTEATDSNEKLYGEERLNRYLNALESADPEKICKSVLSDVDRFVGSAPQFDDITMLCLTYLGHGKELTVDAGLDQIAVVTEFVEGILQQAGCPVKTIMQINVAVDEVFSNIVRYAYKESTGKATVQVQIARAVPSVTLTFLDSGKPFNPLEKEDPDVTLPAGERQIGGLGIYLVKKTMDQVDYEYRDGKNRLRLLKKW